MKAKATILVALLALPLLSDTMLPASLKAKKLRSSSQETLVPGVTYVSAHFDDLFGDGPFTPKEEYVATLLRAVSVLKQQGAGTLIFATTTPAGPGKKDHSIERTAEYNRAAVEALKREGVIINDLFGLVSSDIGAYIRPDDMLHLTATAEIVCAKQTADIIASSITAAAGKRTPGSGNR